MGSTLRGRRTMHKVDAVPRGPQKPVLLKQKNTWWPRCRVVLEENLGADEFGHEETQRRVKRFEYHQTGVDPKQRSAKTPANQCARCAQWDSIARGLIAWDPAARGPIAWDPAAWDWNPIARDTPRGSLPRGSLPWKTLSRGILLRAAMSRGTPHVA